jgi:hypothetical protein
LHLDNSGGNKKLHEMSESPGNQIKFDVTALGKLKKWKKKFSE